MSCTIGANVISLLLSYNVSHLQQYCYLVICNTSDQRQFGLHNHFHWSSLCLSLQTYIYIITIIMKHDLGGYVILKQNNDRNWSVSLNLNFFTIHTDKYINLSLSVYIVAVYTYFNEKKNYWTKLSSHDDINFYVRRCPKTIIRWQ